MKLIEFINNDLSGDRRKLEAALGISQAQLRNMISNGCYHVERIESGFVLTTIKNKYFNL